MRIFNLARLPALLLAPLFVACAGHPTTGSVTVSLERVTGGRRFVDGDAGGGGGGGGAPGATSRVHALVATVSEIYLQGAQGRVVLRDTRMLVDFVGAGGVGVTSPVALPAIIQGAPVPNGTFEQLRFVIEGAYLDIDEPSGRHIYASPGYDQVPAGVEVDGALQLPSWGSSGLKVQLGAITVQGDQQIVVLSFDPAASLQTRTGSGKWVLSPVIRATNLEVTAAIEVTVSTSGLAPGAIALLASTTVELSDRDGNLVGGMSLADPDGDGTFTASFRYLAPSDGPFAVRLTPPAGVVITTSPAFPVMVPLTSGTIAGVHLTVTAIAMP